MFIYEVVGLMDPYPLHSLYQYIKLKIRILNYFILIKLPLTYLILSIII